MSVLSSILPVARAWPEDGLDRAEREFDPRLALLAQADIARTLGSPLVAGVLSAAALLLDRAPRLEARLAAWEGDPRASAMALRLNAGFHALARRGDCPTLSALYAGRHDDFLLAVGDALAAREGLLLAWLDHPTQTNEVMRSGAIMAALLTLAKVRPLPFELLEVGSSAGLNLVLDRYDHHLGGVRAGDPASPLRIAPAWRGPPPPRGEVAIATARGTDLRPLSVRDPAACERLMSFVWADDRARLERLEQAIRLARSAPPAVDAESAGVWAARQLGAERSEPRWRVLIHSMTMQYLPPAEHQAVRRALVRASAAASPERPLAAIGFEWNPARTEVGLGLSYWLAPGERRQLHLARCHAYGAWVEWLGQS